jgi:hypothetical protein
MTLIYTYNSSIFKPFIKMKKTLILILPALSLCSCLTMVNGSKHKVYFESSPTHAEIYVDGKNTGAVTPAEVKIKRRVKAGTFDNNLKNQHIYTLKKEGCHDITFKDQAKYRKIGIVSYNLSPLLVMVPLPLVAALGVGLSVSTDLWSGAYIYYKKEQNVELIEKEKEQKTVYLRDTTIIIKEKTVYLTDTTKKVDLVTIPKTYAIVIGVSEYQNPKMNLKYADDDAVLFYDFLKSPNGGSVPEKQITLLIDAKATRANIIKALNQQLKNALPEDQVYLYLACHGMPGATGNDLYFLTHDTDNENLEGTAVSQQDIQKVFSNCSAKKKIWISDACHSGGVGLDAVSMRGEEEVSRANMVSRLLTNVASYDVNLILLSASSAGQTSRESENWGGGHGVFTYYLVKGLRGDADENKNGLVDIRETFEYVRENVANDTEKKQFPELKGQYKDRFPLSVITAERK